jgi:hypothetical protein
MPTPVQRAEQFHYLGYTIDSTRGEVCCSYATGGHTFTERYLFGADGDWTSRFVEPSVRILFLLAGVSYYKTTAARTIDLGTMATTADERAFLADYYTHGLGEFAYRNGLDLGDLTIVGPDAAPAPSPCYVAQAGRPLIPFGGGIDSIVTVNAIAAAKFDAALCIVHPPNDRFAAIEEVAQVTELPVVHIERELSPLVRRSEELGFFNGHVPITAVITAAALVAAILGQRDAVVLSNEHSASVPTLVIDELAVNHQWSKGIEFEQGFARLVETNLGSDMSVFSFLRCRSELWVAREFAQLSKFHKVFRSCNRAFLQDRNLRLDHWCGTCDKCCFIDLILAPFMEAAHLRAVFNGSEPLDNPELEDRFTTLLGTAPDTKPFECVGDVDECRAALVLAAARPDRSHSPLLQSLRTTLPRTSESSPSAAIGLLAPIGPHYIPDAYAPPDLLVRAH